MTMVSSSVAAGLATQLNAMTPNMPDSMSPSDAKRGGQAVMALHTHVRHYDHMRRTEHSRRARVCWEEGEEAGVLPVSDTGHDVLHDVVQHCVQLLRCLRSLLWQHILCEPPICKA